MKVFETSSAGCPVTPDPWTASTYAADHWTPSRLFCLLEPIYHFHPDRLHDFPHLGKRESPLSQRQPTKGPTYSRRQTIHVDAVSCRSISDDVVAAFRLIALDHTFPSSGSVGEGQVPAAQLFGKVVK